MNRRKFLKRAVIGTAVLASSYVYLDNEEMQQALVLPGKIFCDLHSHPSRNYPIEDLMETLGSPGLTGLALKCWTENERDILTYEQALDLLPLSQVTEIDKGKVARCGQGYIARTQEVLAGRHHLLALGWEGGYFPSYQTIKEAVDDIHARGGIAILNHPFAITGKRMLRLPKTQGELDLIREACTLVDEMETHNAFCVNILPYALDFREMNKNAEDLRQREFPHFRGVASSDCHHYLDQVKLAGIYIDKDAIETKGMKGITEAIRGGNFIRFGDAQRGPYVSRYNLLKVALRGILG
ncbi:hypothetical protein HYT55_04050 [Candidatus Woesearchaeota archaeon]|nr:hypothetical protein [Candidatus Woesearchaeota archaeon]